MYRFEIFGLNFLDLHLQSLGLYSQTPELDLYCTFNNVRCPSKVGIETVKNLLCELLLIDEEKGIGGLILQRGAETSKPALNLLLLALDSKHRKRIGTQRKALVITGQT